MDVEGEHPAERAPRAETIERLSFAVPEEGIDTEALSRVIGCHSLPVPWPVRKTGTKPGPDEHMEIEVRIRVTSRESG